MYSSIKSNRICNLQMVPFSYIRDKRGQHNVRMSMVRYRHFSDLCGLLSGKNSTGTSVSSGHLRSGRLFRTGADAPEHGTDDGCRKPASGVSETALLRSTAQCGWGIVFGGTVYQRPYCIHLCTGPVSQECRMARNPILVRGKANPAFSQCAGTDHTSRQCSSARTVKRALGRN